MFTKIIVIIAYPIMILALFVFVWIVYLIIYKNKHRTLNYLIQTFVIVTFIILPTLVVNNL